MNSKKVILVLVGVVIIVELCIFVVYQQKGNQLFPSAAHQTAANIPQPQKTDFGTSAPTDFPTDIPVEEGTKVEQSYSLNYVGQKQLTIVFPSTKTVKENYALYSDFLKKQNWNIANKYEGARVSSLYATKDSSEINVTINENISTPPAKSQVSISILKK